MGGETYAALSRKAQGNFRKNVFHRRELLKALQGLHTNLGEVARKVKDQRAKTTAVGNRVANLEKRRAERRRTIQADLAKARHARRAITEKMRRMHSLKRTLENIKRQKISHKELLRRMRKKAKGEMNQMKLGNLNLWRKLRRVEKNLRHQMRELQSGKYSNMESLRKLEQWREVKSRTWEKIARDTERKFKREETEEKRFIAALRRARMRAAGMLRNVARGLK